MDAPEFEIEIRPNGEVKVLVKGAGGPRCLNYADMLTEIIGKEKNRQLTTEYYEQDSAVQIHNQQRRK